MSLWNRAKAAYRALTWNQFDELAILGGPPVVAGVHVSQQTANSVAAYWNGICVISGDLGVIDRLVYRRGGADDRERATSHPAYKLVHDQPNPETTAMQFWETIYSHAAGWGNGYAEIEFDNAMRPIAIWNVPPNQMEVRCETFTDRRGRLASRKYYVYKGQTRLEYWDVLHIPGLGFDGVRGYSPVELARQSLGLTIAAERFGAAFFGNGAFPGVALQHQGTLTEPAHARLKKSFHEKTGGANAHGVFILEEGMTVSKPISIPPDDAQFLETREFQIEEIARWLNLPPHKLKHKVGERPGGNFEASELDYQVTTLLPWATRAEQECDRKLISPAQRGQFYTEHNFQKRLLTDTETRMGSYKTLFDLHVIDEEQIARFENLPKPKPRPEPPAPAPPPPPAPVAADPDPAPQAAPRGHDVPALKRAQEALLVAEIARFMRREAEQAKRAAGKSPEGFQRWVETFYAGGEEGVLASSLEPAVRVSLVLAGSDRDPAGVARTFARGYIARSKAAMLEVKAKELPAAVPALLKRWESARAIEALADLGSAITAKEEERNAV